MFRGIFVSFFKSPGVRASFIAVRPTGVFYHDQEEIFIARSGHLSRRGKAAFIH